MNSPLPTTRSRRLAEARAALAKYETLDAESRQQFTVRTRDGDTQWAEEIRCWRAEVARLEARS